MRGQRSRLPAALLALSALEAERVSAGAPADPLTELLVDDVTVVRRTAQCTGFTPGGELPPGPVGNTLLVEREGQDVVLRWARPAEDVSEGGERDGRHALGAVLSAYLKRRCWEFGVTDKRVLIKTGIVGRHTLETLLTKVENIGVEQTLWGRLFNFGTIYVTGTGSTRETFAGIHAPLEFRKAIEAAAVAFEERGPGGRIPAGLT